MYVKTYVPTYKWKVVFIVLALYHYIVFRDGVSWITDVKFSVLKVLVVYGSSYIHCFFFCKQQRVCVTFILEFSQFYNAIVFHGFGVVSVFLTRIKNIFTHLYIDSGNNEALSTGR